MSFLFSFQQCWLVVKSLVMILQILAFRMSFLTVVDPLGRRRRISHLELQGLFVLRLVTFQPFVTEISHMCN